MQHCRTQRSLVELHCIHQLGIVAIFFCTTSKAPARQTYLSIPSWPDHHPPQRHNKRSGRAGSKAPEEYKTTYAVLTSAQRAADT